MLDGDPRVVVVSAESGYGKTRLIDEFARSVDAKSVVMLSVAVADHGEGGGRNTELLAKSILRSPWLTQLGSARPLANSMRDDLVRLERLLTGDGGSVADSVVSVFHQAARRRVVILCADDLHWADVSFIRLLSDLATLAAEERRRGQAFHLLMLLAHRPTDDERRGPGLDRLSRPSPFAQRLRLRVLNEPDVHEVVRRMTGRPVDPRTLERLLRLTRGVPMLVEEAGRALVGSGTDAMDLSLDALVDIASVARRRLSEIGDEVISILQAIALDATDPSVDELTLITRIDPLTIARHVETAIKRRVLTIRDAKIRFVHPAFAEYLRAALSPDQQTVLHSRYVDALTVPGQQAIDVVRLSHHVLAAHRGGTDHVAVLASAAASTFATGAYRAAARFAEAAANSTADPIDQARLWQQAGLAAVRDHDPVRAATLLNRAIAGAAHAQDPVLEAEVMYSRLRAAATRIADVPDVTRVASSFLSSSGGGVAASRVAEALAELMASIGEIDEARDLAARAVRWASDDIEALVWSEFGSGYVELAGLEPTLALTRLRNSGAQARRFGLAENEAHATVRLALAAWIFGDIEHAHRDATRGVDMCLELHDWAEAALANAILAGVHLVRGDLDAVDERGRNALQLFYRSEYGWGLLIAFPTLAFARAVTGDRAGGHTVLDEWEQVGGRAHPTLRAAVDIESGHLSTAGAYLDARRPIRRPLRMQSLSVGIHAALAGSVVAGPLVASAEAALLEVYDREVNWAPGGPASVGRVLGVLARRRGESGVAMDLLGRALRTSSRGGAQTESARIELELASALADLGDKSAASDALDRSIEIAGPLGLVPMATEAERMALTLARPIRRPQLRTRLGASRDSVAVLMTDIVASTPMILELGDEEWVVLHGIHDEILRGCIDVASGIEFAHAGDGLAAWFADADAAIQCGLDIHRTLAGYGSEHLLDRPLTVRVGICWGVPIQRGHDLSGIVVWRTARVMSKAGSGQVVVDHELRRNVRHPALLFDELAPVELAGFDGLHRLFLLTA